MEYVIALTGPRGAGKSLTLAYLSYMYMAAGYKCYSNMPIKGTIMRRKFEAEKIEAVNLLTFNKDVGNSFIAIDELQFFADSRRSSSVGNRLLNILGIQIRKKQCNVAFTVQNLNWVDLRWRFQVDIHIACRDLALTEWGKENNCGRGEVIGLKFYDMSGVLTGRPYYEYPEPCLKSRLLARWLWPLYDTYATVGVDEVFRKYKFMPETYHLRAGEDPEYPDPDLGDFIATPGPVQATSRAYMPYLEGMVEALRGAGHVEIRASELGRLCQDQGVAIAPAELGKSLKSLGVERRRDYRGVIYRLS